MKNIIQTKETAEIKEVAQGIKDLREKVCKGSVKKEKPKVATIP